MIGDDNEQRKVKQPPVALVSATGGCIAFRVAVSGRVALAHRIRSADKHRAAVAAGLEAVVLDGDKVQMVGLE